LIFLKIFFWIFCWFFFLEIKKKYPRKRVA
jgi:hypothetical protein